MEEPEYYLVIDKLEGKGLLPGLMTGDRGLEAREVAREARDAGEVADPFVAGMLRFLRMGDPKRVDARISLGVDLWGDGNVPPNSQGLPYAQDGGFLAGGSFRFAPAEWASFQGRGEAQVTFDGEKEGWVREASVRLGWPQATLEAGRFSLWWGPGRHGDFLFTTNAQPLIGVRVRNPRPIPIGGWFRFLGRFQYDWFIARLEEDRPIPHSILSGVRLAVKPASWLEIGVSRAIQMGGEGQDESLSTYLDVLFGQRESAGNTPVGNSQASIDAKVRLPFRYQTVMLYAEAAGEDQSRPGFPTRWAFLGGVFLPTIGSLERGDLRVEYASTITNGDGVWYRHNQYPYIYQGQILGHHLGTDAKDLFAEAHWFLLPSSYLEVNVDITQRSFPGPAREDTVGGSAGIVAWLTKRVRAEGRLAMEWIRNEMGVEGADSSDSSLRLSLAYQFR